MYECMCICMYKCMYVYQFCLNACLHVCLSTRLSICMSVTIHLLECMSVSPCASLLVFCLAKCMRAGMYVCLSICAYVCLSAIVCPSVHLLECMSVYLFVYVLSVSLSFDFLSVYLTAYYPSDSCFSGGCKYHNSPPRTTPGNTTVVAVLRCRHIEEKCSCRSQTFQGNHHRRNCLQTRSLIKYKATSSLRNYQISFILLLTCSRRIYLKSVTFSRHMSDKMNK